MCFIKFNKIKISVCIFFFYFNLGGVASQLLTSISNHKICWPAEWGGTKPVHHVWRQLGKGNMARSPVPAPALPHSAPTYVYATAGILWAFCQITAHLISTLMLDAASSLPAMCRVFFLSTKSSSSSTQHLKNSAAPKSDLHVNFPAHLGRRFCGRCCSLIITGQNWSLISFLMLFWGLTKVQLCVGQNLWTLLMAETSQCPWPCSMMSVVFCCFQFSMLDAVLDGGAKAPSRWQHVVGAFREVLW